jgi:lipid-binding SYLF domain-containing protein
MNATFSKLAIVAAALALVPGCASQDPITRTNAANASASQITRDSREGLASLYSQSHSARALGARARAVLVFPNVTRAGFVFGGQVGNGAMLRRDGSVAGFYQTASASWGLQAGVQRFGYALFLMDDAAVRDLNRAGGWELGGSPSLVVVDRGMAASLSTTTINSGTYAFFFDQRGLMAGLGLQGTKITRIHPGR